MNEKGEYSRWPLLRCPTCGRFIANVEATVNGFEHITKVEGICKTHGTVNVTNQEWGYDDFFPEKKITLTDEPKESE